MIKAVWTAAVLAAVALGISIFGTLVNRSSLQVQQTRVSALNHQVVLDRHEVARLHAELHTLTVTRHGAP